jgi:formylglycine-generating enzyme required for sulfatase activity
MFARRSSFVPVLALVLTWGGALPGSRAVAQAAAPKSRPGRLYALLVGVREYKTPALRPLKYTERDVEGLGSVLADCGYDPKNVHLRILTQTRGAQGLRYLPSSDNIRTELARMLKLVELDADAGTAEDDTIIVALSGHGILDPKTETSFFCPEDTSARNLAPDDAALVNLGTLYDQLKASKAGVKLLFADACRNDPLSANKSVRPVVDLASVTRPLKKRKPGGVAALFSCSDGQVSYEDDDLKHGVFFHFVIEGLKGEADEKGDRDGKVTLGELANYTSKEVYSYVDRTRNDEQLPEYALKANSISLVDRPRIIRLPDLITTKTAGIKLKLIPPGRFIMGSPRGEGDDDEHPQHEVRITRPFYLGLTEVTQGQYETLMGNNPSYFSANGGGMDRVAGQSTEGHPAENVSWLDAVKFCNKLSEKEGLRPFYEIEGDSARILSWDGLGFRLPTEAEWEYACRAGAQTRYAFGDADEGLGDYAWFDEDYARGTTHPVGRKRSSRFGLFDMHGNVWEWCSDAYAAGHYRDSPADDPRGPDPAGAVRVFRGGGWRSGPRFCRSAGRLRVAPADRYFDLGFRLARGQSRP